MVLFGSVTRARYSATERSKEKLHQLPNRSVSLCRARSLPYRQPIIPGESSNSQSEPSVGRRFRYSHETLRLFAAFWSPRSVQAHFVRLLSARAPKGDLSTIQPKEIKN